MSAIRATATGLALLAAAMFAAAADPVHPNVKPDVDFGKIEVDMLANLKPVNSTLKAWSAGWIPQSCKDIATEYDFDPHDFDVFFVTYSDCRVPWTFCRHKEAQASKEDMIANFGRMPVHTRSVISEFIATPSLKGGLALTYYDGHVALGGDPSLHILVHEFSHGLDWHAVTAYENPISDTQVWQDTFAADNASVSDYSKVAWAEQFAEVGIIGFYDAIVPGGAPNIEPGWRDIFHQYSTYESILSDYIPPGGKCHRRINNSETVRMGDADKETREIGPMLDSSFAPDLEVIDLDPAMMGKVHVHS